MTWIVPLLAITTQMPTGDPKDIARLRAGEVVRLYRTGGLTPRGTYFSLMVVTNSGGVFVKDVDGNHTSKLEGSAMASLRKALATTNWKQVTASPRSEPYGPSAYDGTDIYLNFRQGSILRNWNNIQWHFPERFPLLDEVERIRRKTIGKESF